TPVWDSLEFNLASWDTARSNAGLPPLYYILRFAPDFCPCWVLNVSDPVHPDPNLIVTPFPGTTQTCNHAHPDATDRTFAPRYWGSDFITKRNTFLGQLAARIHFWETHTGHDYVGRITLVVAGIGHLGYTTAGGDPQWAGPFELDSAKHDLMV